MSAIRQEIGCYDECDSAQVGQTFGSSGFITLDTADYDGTVSYIFEVAQLGQTGAAVSLRRKGTTTDDATITCSNVVNDIQRVGFTPPGGATDYVIRNPDASGEDLMCRIIVLQSGSWTKTKTRIDVTSQVGIGTPITSTSYATIGQAEYWKYVASRYDGTVSFQWSVVCDMAGAATGSFELDTSTDGTSWAAVGSALTTTSTTPVRLTASFTPVDGNLYRIYAKTSSGSIAVNPRNINIIITQTGSPTKLELQYVLHTSTNGMGRIGVTNWVPSEWSGVTTTFYHQCAVNLNIGTSGDICRLRSPALTGSTLTGSSVTDPQTVPLLISSAVTMPGSSATLDFDYPGMGTTAHESIVDSRILVVVSAPPTAALTGTALASITEADIVTGGKTVIATLTGDTLVLASAGAITYVGSQLGGFAGTTSAQTITFALTGGLASTPAAGDFVIIAYTIGSTADRSLAIRNTSAVDYTLIGSELYADDTFDCNLRVAYRFMPGTPETQFVLTETVSGGTGNVADAGRYTVHVFRGVDSSTPLDVAAVTATGINTRLANPGSITPTTAGAWIYVVGAAAAATGGTYTAGYLTDFRAGSTADTNDAQIGAGYLTWTSGAYDPAAFGAGGTDTANDSWAAVTVALRPLLSTPFNDARAAIASGLDSAQAEAAGWDAKVKPNIPVGNVVRTSDTVVTVTLQAQSDYNITAQETITMTLPAAALAGNAAVVATPTFTVDASGGSSMLPKISTIRQAVPRASNW